MLIIIFINIQDRASQTAMKTNATRECAAHVDTPYLIKNTNHVTTAVAARKHGCINNSWINSNSECAHTHAKHVSFCPRKESFVEKIQQAFPHALNKLNALEALAGRKPESHT